MYFESRGSADIPTVICSAISSDMLNWELEAGIRLQAPGGVGGVRYWHRQMVAVDFIASSQCCPEVPLRELGSQRIVSAITSDGLDFEGTRRPRRETIGLWLRRDHDGE
jgi:hypothetical protein